MPLPREHLLLVACLALTTACPARGEGSPEGNKASQGHHPPRTDLYGDPLPEGAVARLGTVRLRHPGGLGTVTFAPDGNTLASSGADGTVCLWDTNQGRALHEVEWHSAACIAFSPDGKVLAVGHDHFSMMAYMGRHLPGIGLVDLATGKAIQTFWADKSNSVPSLAFSPDGKLLAAANDEGSVMVWDLGAGGKQHQVNVPNKSSYWVAFAPDGKTLLLGSRSSYCHWNQVGPGEIHVWDLAANKDRRRFVVEPKAFIDSLAVSGDGKTLAVLAGGNVHLWDQLTGNKIHDFKRREDIRCLAISPDGKTVALGCYKRPTLDNENGIVYLVDAATGEDRLPGLPGYAGSIAFAPDGKLLATGGNDSAIRLWDTRTGKAVLPLGGAAGAVTCVAFSHDGKSVVSGADGGTVCLWESATGREQFRRRLRTGFGAYAGFGSVTISPDGTILASPNDRPLRPADGDNAAVLWNVLTGKGLLTMASVELKPKGTYVCPVVVSPDGKMAAAAGEGDIVVLWDVVTGTERLRLPKHEGGVHDLVFSADGGTLVSCCSPEPENGAGTRLVISLWDLSSGKLIRTIEGGDRTTGPVALSPDGKLCATWNPTSPDYVIQIWDVASGREWRRLTGRAWYVKSLLFSPNGRMLAAGDELGWIGLWELQTAKEVLRLAGHRGAVNSLAFDPEGRHLASASSDTTVLVWDLAAAAIGKKPRHP